MNGFRKRGGAHHEGRARGCGAAEADRVSVGLAQGGLEAIENHLEAERVGEDDGREADLHVLRDGQTVLGALVGEVGVVVGDGQVADAAELLEGHGVQREERRRVGGLARSEHAAVEVDQHAVGGARLKKELRGA